MKKFSFMLAVLITLGLIFSPASLFAKETGKDLAVTKGKGHHWGLKKGEKAAEKDAEKAKKEAEKAAAKAKKEAEKAAKAAEKEAKKAKKAAEKEAAKAKKKIEKEAKKI